MHVLSTSTGLFLWCILNGPGNKAVVMCMLDKLLIPMGLLRRCVNNSELMHMWPHREVTLSLITLFSV